MPSVMVYMMHPSLWRLHFCTSWTCLEDVNLYEPVRGWRLAKICCDEFRQYADGVQVIFAPFTDSLAAHLHEQKLKSHARVIGSVLRSWSGKITGSRGGVMT